MFLLKVPAGVSTLNKAQTVMSNSHIGGPQRQSRTHSGAVKFDCYCIDCISIYESTATLLQVLSEPKNGMRPQGFYRRRLRLNVVEPTGVCTRRTAVISSHTEPAWIEVPPVATGRRSPRDVGRHEAQIPMERGVP